VTVVPFETSFIYFPSRLLEATPADFGLAFEEVFLATEDGVRIHAWRLPHPSPRFTILFAHGNAGNISHRLDRARLLASRLSAEVFLFDYRGYGRSEGRPDEQGTYRDARAAHRHLIEAQGVTPDRLVLFGESLGSAVVLDLALERAARALVLESPFTSIPDMARLVLPWLPLSALLQTRYDNLAKVGGLKLPLLVAHGDRDEVVPFAQGRRVFEAAPEPKRFHRIAGAGHNDTYLRGGEAYWEVLDEFLGRDPLPAEGRS
jgi:fermentation-respiration switch protein FrsA (DUF1100 family)